MGENDQYSGVFLLASMYDFLAKESGVISGLLTIAIDA